MLCRYSIDGRTRTRSCELTNMQSHDGRTARHWVRVREIHACSVIRTVNQQLQASYRMKSRTLAICRSASMPRRAVLYSHRCSPKMFELQASLAKMQRHSNATPVWFRDHAQRDDILWQMPVDGVLGYHPLPRSRVHRALKACSSQLAKLIGSCRRERCLREQQS